MKGITLLQVRYWLEIIALPIFIFLVIHLAGEGFWGLLEGGHDYEAGHLDSSILTYLCSREVLTGIVLCGIFIGLWRKTSLQKWVPCAHEHCHHEVHKVPHVLAILVLCAHFFPEAGVRYILFTNVYGGGVINILGVLGFMAHFLVDVIVMIFVSLYWKSRMSSVLSFLSIFLCWILAFMVGERIMEYFPDSLAGGLLFGSAFLLAMFIHMPHKPVVSCKNCD